MHLVLSLDSHKKCKQLPAGPITMGMKTKRNTGGTIDWNRGRELERAHSSENNCVFFFS